MQPADDEPTSAETGAARRSRLGRGLKLILRASGVILAVGAAVEHGPIAEAAHYAFARTSAERVVGDGIERATGSRMMIRCVSADDMAANFDMPPEKAKLVQAVTFRDPIFGSPYAVHLNERRCDDLVLYGRYDSVRRLPEPDLGMSFVHAAHEAHHYRTNSRDESATNCLSVQQAAAFAKAFGATDEQAARLSASAAAVFEAPTRPDDPLIAQYIIDGRCVPGGPLDAGVPGGAFPPVGTMQPLE